MYVVTLVHGTWAQDAAWTAEGSPMRATLQELLSEPVIYTVFSWSGKNSISARSLAAEQLKAHLYGCLDRYPTAKHYVIAHSHGGNIALYALQDSDLRSRVSGTICLSTPFLWVRPRNLGPYFEEAGALCGCVLLIAWGVFLDSIPPFSGIISSVTGGPIAAIIVLLTLIFELPFLLLVGFGLRRWRTTVSELRSSLSQPELAFNHLLIVRESGDEASTALSVPYFAAWGLGQLWSAGANVLLKLQEGLERIRSRSVLARGFALLSTVSSQLAVYVAICLAAIPFFWLDTDSLSPFSKAALMVACASSTLAFLFVVGFVIILFVAQTAFAVTLIPLTLVFGLLMVPFGWAAFVAGIALEISPEAGPPGRYTTLHAGFDERSSGAAAGLQHSYCYRDLSVFRGIAEWVESHGQAQTAETAR